MEVDLSTAVLAVALNPEGTRLLRSWLHIEPCVHCQTQDETGEVAVSPVRY